MEEDFPRSQCGYCKWAAGALLHPRDAQFIYDGHRWHQQCRQPQPEQFETQAVTMDFKKTGA